MQLYRLFKNLSTPPDTYHVQPETARLCHGIRGSELREGDGFHGWREAGANAAAVMVDRGAPDIGEAPARGAVGQHHQRGLA